MSTLTFKLKQAPVQVLDLSALVPARLIGLSSFEMATLPVTAGGDVVVGDIFDIAGEIGDTIVFAGGSPFFDNVGAGLAAGKILVEGSVGNNAGAKMKGGALEISGDAGSHLATGVSGGVIRLKGSAGDFVGGIRPGDKFGMLGGAVVIDGNTGARAGERMRRGLVVVRGTFGPAAGSRMVGGTLWTETGFGAGPGPLLRRGTLIGPTAEGILPTFADCGRHDLNILKILSRYVAETLGSLAPKPLPGLVQKLAGDLATIGKGELLLTG